MNRSHLIFNNNQIYFQESLYWHNRIFRFLRTYTISNSRSSLFVFSSLSRCVIDQLPSNDNPVYDERHTKQLPAEA